MRTLAVNLGTRSYPIHMGTGLLARAGELLAPVLGAGKIGIITNPTVGELYLKPLETTLRARGLDVASVLVPDGEEHKNLSSLAAIYEQLIAQRFERNSVLIALGGGVVGDLTGFAAATFLRGIPYIQIPTTLLAQVDSSVGGKTGVNHRAGKNLIGAFYQPRAVLIDVEVLATLPRREFLAGMAEVIKYGIIADSKLFKLLEEKIECVVASDQDLLIEIIASSCADKASVVEKDEREEDYRAVLNFGHTIGHALEALTGYEQFLHGEAVAMGMVQATKISRVLDFCDDSSFRRIHQLIARTGLPAELPAGLDLTALAAHIEIDKKSSGGKVKFVCCVGIGATCFHWLSPQEIVRALSPL
jgi:3-dehydroquinate synthase